MSQNQEIIESKLCAYVDGELDSEGRAEIEKHLEANPQHRRLLESLRATRDLLKWLPREPAPPELAETLNGQLERSVLLDYDGDTRRAHAFPRILAAAAIVLLTVGLAAAVYFALPKSQRSVVAFRSAGESNVRPLPADTAPSTPPTPELTTGDMPAERSDTFSKLAEQEHLKADQTAENRSFELAKREGPDGQTRKELDQLASAVTQNSAAYFGMTEAAASNRATEPLSNALVVLVRSKDPDAAQKQLTEYLQSNGIQWKPAEPQSNAEGGAAPATNPSEQLALRRESDDGKFNYKQAAPQPPASQPAQADLPATLSQTPGPREIQAWQDAPQRSANVSTNLYVARMSRRQAADLTTSITRDGTQTARLKDLLGDSTSDMDAAPAQSGSESRPTALGAAKAAEPPLPSTNPAIRDRSALQDGEAGAYATRELRHATAGMPNGPVQSLARRAPREQVPATQPAAERPMPTTMPTDEQPVDVVIVVQPTEAAQSQPPATQPAGVAPQTQP